MEGLRHQLFLGEGGFLVRGLLPYQRPPSLLVLLPNLQQTRRCCARRTSVVCSTDGGGRAASLLLLLLLLRQQTQSVCVRTGEGGLRGMISRSACELGKGDCDSVGLRANWGRGIATQSVCVRTGEGGLRGHEL